MYSSNRGGSKQRLAGLMRDDTSELLGEMSFPLEII